MGILSRLGPLTNSETETIDTGLANKDDAEVRQRAFERLFASEHEKLNAWLAQKYPGLPSDYRDIAVSQAFVAVWDIVEGDGKWNESPMASLSGIYEIAHRRAVDALRVYTKRGKRKTQPTSDEALLEIANAKRSDDPSAPIDFTREERDSLEFLREQIEAAVNDLPPTQQRLARLLIENFEDLLTYEELQELYQNKYCEPIPFASVKSAKVEIRDKLAPIYEPYRRRYTTLWHRISPRRNPPA